MGKEKYRRDIEQLFAQSPVVSYTSIKRLIQNKKKVKQYTKRLIHDLLVKGKIKRLAKGFYTTHADTSLAVFCFQPAYLGLQDALSAHHLWEQETIPVVITVRKVRPGMRKILGSNVLIRRIEKKYLFGIEHFQEGNIAFPYSDIEKTFLDMLYFKEPLSEEAVATLRKRINRKKLVHYLAHYPKKIRHHTLKLLKSKSP